MIHAAIRAREPERAREAARLHLVNSMSRYRQRAAKLGRRCGRIGHLIMLHDNI